MNLKNLFFGLAACLALCACSNEEDFGNGATSNGLDEAYMSIRLFNAEGTRGTLGNNTNGSDKENKVNTIDFYFYNNDGTFNQHVAKTGADFNDWEGQTDGNNVEEIGNAAIILKNLKQVGQPTYVVAVINSQKGGNKYMYLSLTDLQKELIKDAEGYATDDQFLITNSTYNNGDATSMYFATKITRENFLKEKPTAETLSKGNAVQIYVERVAAKVSLTTSTGSANIPIGTYLVDGKDETLTINITGWGLNATNKESYLMKNVPAWDFDATWMTWDNRDNFRSHWAMSPNYGEQNGIYPTSYGFPTEGDELTNLNKTESLNYKSWSDMTKQVNDVDYCMENTNTADELQKNKNIRAVATHILLAAELTNKKDLVRFYGQLYTKEGFLNNVLSQLTTKYYKKEGETYKQIEITDVEAKNAYDGKVYVGLTDAAFAEPWYTDENGTTVASTAVNASLKLIFDDGNDGNTSSREYAEYYAGGKMYYCIPIEHIRGGEGIDYADANDGTYTVNVGEFGVVRNHWYNVNVNKIQNLGTAVYNPEELIVPNPEEPTYFVGANINILAWQIVNQGVDL